MELLTVINFEETTNSPSHAVHKEVLITISVESLSVLLILLEGLETSLKEVKQLRDLHYFRHVHDVTELKQLLEDAVLNEVLLDEFGDPGALFRVAVFTLRCSIFAPGRE